MLIRRERPEDRDEITAIHDEAFRGPVVEPDAHSVESLLVTALRAGDAWIEQLSLVAVDDSAPVGHVVCSRAVLEPAGTAVLGLGPLGVRRAAQRNGVGSALMHAVLAAAEARNEPMVCLLGDPGYYARFGFVTSTHLGVAAPAPRWGVHFQARILGTASPALEGTFRYASAFDSL